MTTYLSRAPGTGLKKALPLASALLMALAFLATADAANVYYASSYQVHYDYYNQIRYNCGYYGCGAYGYYDYYPYAAYYDYAPSYAYPGAYPAAQADYHAPYEPHEWERPYGRPLCYLRGGTWMCYY